VSAFAPCYVIYLDDKGRQRFWPNAGLVVPTVSWWIASVIAAVFAERGADVTVVEKL
jgi:NADPH-dependent 2,4-dienoyl-CoA reductase/sulfur reductase-like enzyme